MEGKKPKNLRGQAEVVHGEYEGWFLTVKSKKTQVPVLMDASKNSYGTKLDFEEVEGKEGVYKICLKPIFGGLPLYLNAQMSATSH